MKFALCSEVYKTPIEETMRSAHAIGFDGIEIAPFNLAAHVDDVSAARRREIVAAAKSLNLDIVGLHWLLVSPEGMNFNGPDSQNRERTFEYLRKLVHLCGDLGGRVMVLGSPKARNIPPGANVEETLQRAAEGLRSVAEVCTERRVRLLLEPLTPKETNFLNTVEETMDMARRVDHPQVSYILDTKAMSAMPLGIEGTIRKWGLGSAHFHANEPTGLGPGMGALDFTPIFKALRESGFLGWASAEPFNYEPNSDTVARTALRTMREAALAAGWR